MCLSSILQSLASGSYKRSTTWQKHRRLEDEVKTTWNNSLRAGYEYGTDNEGRRTSEDVTGPIATKFNPGYTYGFRMTWTYTDRGEVDVNKSEKLDSSGDPIENSISLWDRDWDWDSFSNRTKEKYNGTSDTTYSGNSLNQYSSITGYLSEPDIVYDDDGNLTDDEGMPWEDGWEERFLLQGGGLHLSATAPCPPVFSASEQCTDIFNRCSHDQGI